MSGLILLSLPLSLLIFSLLVVIAILDVAWRTPSFARKGAGACLMPTSAILPASDMMHATSGVTGEIARGDFQLICPATPFVPQVTDLEANAIGVEISRQGSAEVERVLQRSRAHDGMCPMRLRNGLCACAMVRPLDCVGRCFAGADSPEWAEGLGQSVSTAFRQHLQRHHVDSATHRLDDALIEILDHKKCPAAVPAEA